MTRFGLDLAAYNNIVDLEPNINENFRRIAEGQPDVSYSAAQLRDLQPTNLLTNGGFEIWQRGTGPFAMHGSVTSDRWEIDIVGTDTLSVARDATNTDVGSLAAAACTFVLGSGGGASTLLQPLRTSDGFQVNGRTLSASIRVRSSTPNAVRLAINPGATGVGVFSDLNAGGAAWETLIAPACSIPSDATWVFVQVFFSASATVYLDNAMLVVGEVPAAYVPLHPADELARCLRYYERLSGANTATLLSGSQAYNAINATGLWSFNVRKAVTATVTSTPASTLAYLNAAAAPIALTAISFTGASVDRVTITGTVAGGLVAGDAATAIANVGQTATLAAEANP